MVGYRNNPDYKVPNPFGKTIEHASRVIYTCRSTTALVVCVLIALRVRNQPSIGKATK